MGPQYVVMNNYVSPSTKGSHMVLAWFFLPLLLLLSEACPDHSFLAHLAKGHVSFCHHLASVVRRKLSHLNLLLKLLNQIKPNLAGMVPGWVPFKIVSDRFALHSSWLLLLKIEISSIVHCCFSLSQNELKFYLQLPGQEKFNIYSGFFCEFFLSADLCKLCIFW